MTRNYNPFARGRRFEYRTRDYLRKLGWFVIRQPRSSFPDLVAFRGGSILLVECKVGGCMSSTERRHIVRLARLQVRGTPVLAFRKRLNIALSKLSGKSAKFDRSFDPHFQNSRKPQC